MAAENPISIDLNEIHAAFGYVPHPQCDSWQSCRVVEGSQQSGRHFNRCIGHRWSRYRVP